MSNLITATVTIQGTRPMLWHRFGPDAIPLEKREKTGVAGNDPEEWRRTCLVTKDGQLYLEGAYVFSTVKNGARYTSKKRGNYMADMAATLQVETGVILVDRWFPGWPNGHVFDVTKEEPPPQDITLPVYLDVRSVVNPSTKARNVRYRIAASEGWSCLFRLLWDKTIIDRNVMQAAIIDAGKLVGIGNGRAIGYGRFDMVGFEID